MSIIVICVLSFSSNFLISKYIDYILLLCIVFRPEGESAKLKGLTSFKIELLDNLMCNYESYNTIEGVFIVYKLYVCKLTLKQYRNFILLCALIPFLLDNKYKFYPV